MSVSRLTKGSEKHNGEFVSYVADVSLYPEMMGYEYVQADMDCINKLGKLEDLEEELGIDFITLFKAFNKGIWFNCSDLYDLEKNFTSRPRLYYSDDNKCWCFEIGLGAYVVKLKDFHKTWWLEKPKENEDD